MQTNGQTHKANGEDNEKVLLMQKSQPAKADSPNNAYISIFDPNKYMLKLPKTKKIIGDNGMLKWEKTETDYLPVTECNTSKEATVKAQFIHDVFVKSQP